MRPLLRAMVIAKPAEGVKSMPSSSRLISWRHYKCRRRRGISQHKCAGMYGLLSSNSRTRERPKSRGAVSIIDRRRLTPVAHGAVASRGGLGYSFIINEIILIFTLVLELEKHHLAIESLCSCWRHLVRALGGHSIKNKPSSSSCRKPSPIMYKPIRSRAKA